MPEIIILDDQLEFAANLQELLELEGFQTSIFQTDSDEFYKRACGEQTALILINKQLSDGCDGTGVCWRIRKLYDQTLTPLILTTNSSEGVNLDPLQGGADAVLTKPFSLFSLIEVIRDLIQRRASLESEEQSFL
jgi:DNA-binding response OmpR family regulator